nr:unnamed protein product [Callosobruchus chinensis]
MLMSQSPTAPSAGSNIAASPSQAAVDTQAQQIRQGQEARKCANCDGDHPENSPSCRFTPRRNLQVIAQRQTISYADATKVAALATPTASSSPSTAQTVDLATALKSLQQIISPLIKTPHRPCRRFFR